MLTDQEVKSIFFELEKHPRLGEFKIKGVSLYYILRFPLEMKLRFAHGKNEKASSNSFLKKVKSKTKSLFLKNEKLEDVSAYFDKRSTAKKSKFLFVGTSIFMDKKGQSSDMSDIVDFYHTKGEQINFIQPTTNKRPFPKKNKKYNAYLPLPFTSAENLNEEERQKLSSFLKLAESVLKIDLIGDYLTYANSLKNTMIRAEALANYIVELDVDFVYAISVYSEPWLPMACLRNKAKLIEVQHGVVGEHNIYYQSILGQKGLKDQILLMPDYMLTMGKEWGHIIQKGAGNYFDQKNMLTLGVKQLEKVKPTNTSENSIRVVFLLQRRNLNRLLSIPDLIIAFIEKYRQEIINLNIKIVIRPHPHDYHVVDFFKKRYDDLITIEDSKVVESLDSIAKSDLIAGATSMCLYEALTFGKTAVSFTEFKGMTTGDENIVFLDSPEELYSVILSSKEKTKKSVPYLDSFNEKVLGYFLELKKNEVEG